MTLGGRLKELREARDVSLDDLAKATSLSRGNLWRYENDKFVPGLRVFTTICKALAVTPNEFLRFDEADEIDLP